MEMRDGRDAALTTPVQPAPSIEARLASSVGCLDLDGARRKYYEQDEFLVLENLIPREVIAQWEIELDALKPQIHRNFIPKHKKGGSVDYNTVAQLAPSMAAV